MRSEKAVTRAIVLVHNFVLFGISFIELVFQVFDFKAEHLIDHDCRVS